jgi:hypothetical protein
MTNFIKMTDILLILKLFGGLILLYILGRTIGHLFKLDKYYEDIHKNKNENIKRCGNENDQYLPIK